MIKVLIADDMEPLLKKYEKILSKTDDIEIVETVQTGYQAVMMAAIHKPDVVLMDVEMESRTAGLDATEQILKQFPNTKIIILTVYEDDDTVFKAFKLGVSDYILKNSSPENIITCVKDAYRNLSPIRPVIAKKIRDEFQRVKKSEESFQYCLQVVTQMTQAELDILNLSMQGYTRAQICEIRFVELSTVKTQIHSILKKFNKNSMAEVQELLDEVRILDYLRNIGKSLKTEDEK